VNHRWAPKIGDVTESVKTWNPARSNGPFRYIDLSAVNQIDKVISTAALIEPFDAPSRARQLVRTDDVLVSTVRPNLNGVAIVSSEFDGATASTGFCVLRPTPSKLDPKYLFHWVRTPQFVSDMVRNATGASYPAVSDRIIKNSVLPLPTLEEQRRISAILDKVDALFNMRNRSIALLDSLTQSLFFETFGDPISNPKGLTRKPLGELIRVKSGEGLTSAKMDQNGPFIVYGGNGPNGRHSSYMFAEPKVVIGRVGVYCGAVHITSPRSWVTDNALYVSENHQELDISYLAAALRVADLNQYAGRAAQPLISGGRIYPVKILVPPKEDQMRFSVALSRVQSLRDNAHLSRFSDLRASLQHSAFSGRASW
jgi:type I restriction enzyme, S subunit